MNVINFQAPNQNVCFNFNTTLATQCQVRKLNLGVEVVIPMFDLGLMQPCTAIFNINNFQWRKLKSDERQVALGGHLMR